jgi:hypothetical protein
MTDKLEGQGEAVSRDQTSFTVLASSHRAPAMAREQGRIGLRGLAGQQR